MSSTARSNSDAAICVSASVRLEAVATTEHPMVIRISSVISRTSGSSSTTIVRSGDSSAFIADRNPQGEDASRQLDGQIAAKPGGLIANLRGPARLSRQDFLDQPRPETAARRRADVGPRGLHPVEIELLID